MSDELEPPRPDVDFRVLVLRGSRSVDVTHAVMDVYDIAINSMDFGSGFLSTEEVGNLRALGEAIGAERFDYQHDKCLRCGNDFECHNERRFGTEGTKITCTYRGKGCAGFISPVAVPR